MLKMPVRAVGLEAAKADTKDTLNISKSIIPRLVPGKLLKCQKETDNSNNKKTHGSSQDQSSLQICMLERFQLL